MKSTILLTTALFLASAPAPDSQTISELSAGFLSVGNDHGLLAAETSLDTPFDSGTASQQVVPTTFRNDDLEVLATQAPLQSN